MRSGETQAYGPLIAKESSPEGRWNALPAPLLFVVIVALIYPAIQMVHFISNWSTLSQYPYTDFFTQSGYDTQGTLVSIPQHLLIARQASLLLVLFFPPFFVCYSWAKAFRKSDESGTFLDRSDIRKMLIDKSLIWFAFPLFLYLLYLSEFVLERTIIFLFADPLSILHRTIDGKAYLGEYHLNELGILVIDSSITSEIIHHWFKAFAKMALMTLGVWSFWIAISTHLVILFKKAMPSYLLATALTILPPVVYYYIIPSDHFFLWKYTTITEWGGIITMIIFPLIIFYYGPFAYILIKGLIEKSRTPGTQNKKDTATSATLQEKRT